MLISHSGHIVFCADISRPDPMIPWPPNQYDENDTLYEFHRNTVDFCASYKLDGSVDVLGETVSISSQRMVSYYSI